MAVGKTYKERVSKEVSSSSWDCLQRTRCVHPYLGAVNPGGGTKAHAIAECVDEYENHTGDVGSTVGVIWED